MQVASDGIAAIQKSRSPSCNAPIRNPPGRRSRSACRHRCRRCSHPLGTGSNGSEVMVLIEAPAQAGSPAQNVGFITADTSLISAHACDELVMPMGDWHVVNKHVRSAGHLDLGRRRVHSRSGDRGPACAPEEHPLSRLHSLKCCTPEQTDPQIDITDDRANVVRAVVQCTP